MKKLLLTVTALGLLALAAPTPADAVTVRLPGTWVTLNAPWGMPPAGTAGLALHVTPSGPTDFGLAQVTMPAGTQIEDIGPLAYDHFYERGSCGGGSPRYQLRIDLDNDFAPDANVFVYAGPFPNFGGCAAGRWVNDRLDLGQKRFDASQVGGSFYNTQAEAHAAAGIAHQVLSVTFVWDSAWLFGPSDMWFDDIQVNTYVLDEPLAQLCLHAQPGVVACPGVEVLV